MKFSAQDQKVIEAFVEGRAMSGHRLSTDGHRLDVNWRGVAENINGTITIKLNAGQSVRRTIRGMASPMQIEEVPRARRRGRR